MLDSLLGTMCLLGDDDDGTEEALSDDSLASLGGAGFGKKNLRILSLRSRLYALRLVCFVNNDADE